MVQSCSPKKWTVKSNYGIETVMKPSKANTRRLTTRGAAMRERIVSAAADLVWAQGAGETSLDDVMEKSGASKSQLYHYFADKDALLREAAALQTKRVLATHGQLLDSLDALRRWRDAVLALNSQDGCPLGALVYQLPQSAKRARTVVGDGFETWRMQVEKGLVKMRDRGELSRDASPADIALAVLTALQGGLLLSKGEKSNRPLEVAFEMALAYVAAHDRRAAGERKPIRTG
jgi:TetR/AcrR family transcriptional regulator, transcriptional repressor for nem operon